MQLSPHFSLEELTYSPTAQEHRINNTPPPVEMDNLIFTASKLEEVRAILGNKPIYITSGYRGMQLNKIIGGVSNSQHSKGEAVDFHCKGWGSPRSICLELMKHKQTLRYDQLILEPTWVHISFVKGTPRMNDLTLIGKNKYGQGIY